MHLLELRPRSAKYMPRWIPRGVVISPMVFELPRDWRSDSTEAIGIVVTAAGVDVLVVGILPRDLADAIEGDAPGVAVGLSALVSRDTRAMLGESLTALAGAETPEGYPDLLGDTRVK